MKTTETQLARAIVENDSKGAGPYILTTTPGDSTIITLPGYWHDDDRPRDIAAVNAWGTIVALAPTTNPEWIDRMQDALDEIRKAKA